MSKDDDLKKGIKHWLGAGIAATGLATGAMSKPAPTQQPTATESQAKPTFKATKLVQKQPFDIDSLKDAMGMVESGGGKNMNHTLLTRGPDAGTRAKGIYGLTNSTIKETISRDPSLKSKYPDVLGFDDAKMHQAILKEKPDLQHDVTKSRIVDLNSRLKTNKPEHIAYAWINGVTGTKEALNSKMNIENHWHVKRVMDYYGRISKGKALKRSFGNDILELLQKSIEKSPRGTHAKNSPEKSKAISESAANTLALDWKKARKALTEENNDDTSRPDFLREWGIDMEEMKNSFIDNGIVRLLKSSK